MSAEQASLDAYGQVWVRSAGSGAGAKERYHTDPECPRLQAATNPMEKPLSVLPEDIQQCKYCSGEVAASDPSKDHYESLLAAAEQGE